MGGACVGREVEPATSGALIKAPLFGGELDTARLLLLLLVDGERVPAARLHGPRGVVMSALEIRLSNEPLRLVYRANGNFFHFSVATF